MLLDLLQDSLNSQFASGRPQEVVLHVVVESVREVVRDPSEGRGLGQRGGDDGFQPAAGRLVRRCGAAVDDFEDIVPYAGVLRFNLRPVRLQTC